MLIGADGFRVRNENGMSDEATSKSGRTWLHVAVWLGSVLLLYVLSVGPVFVLVMRKVLPDTVLVAYGPLDWISQVVGNDDLFRNYALIWLRLTGTPEP